MKSGCFICGDRNQPARTAEGTGIYVCWPCMSAAIHRDDAKAKAPMADTMTPTIEQALRASRDVDWGQVLANGGPPCFHVEDGRFCLRAKRWDGHGTDTFHGYHRFMTLNELLEAMIALAGMKATALAAADSAPKDGVPAAWIATSPSGSVLHMSKADGWSVDVAIYEPWTKPLGLVIKSNCPMGINWCPAQNAEQPPSLQRYKELCGTEDEPAEPIERLRFFCSLAMSGQDWIDVEPFFDALAQPESAQQEREAFEAWWKSEDFTCESDRKNIAWCSWRAARAAIKGRHE